MKIRCQKCKEDYEVFAKIFRSTKEIVDSGLINPAKAKTPKDADTMQRMLDDNKQVDKFEIPTSVLVDIGCPNKCKGQDKGVDSQCKRIGKQAIKNPIKLFQDVSAKIGANSYKMGNYIRRCNCKKETCNINYIRSYEGEVFVALDGDIDIIYLDRSADESKEIIRWGAIIDQMKSILKKFPNVELSDNIKLYMCNFERDFATSINAMLDPDKRKEYENICNFINRLFYGCFTLTKPISISLMFSFGLGIIMSVFEQYGRNATNKFIKWCLSNDQKDLYRFLIQIGIYKKEGENDVQENEKM